MQHHLEYNGRTRSLGPGVLTIGSGREAGWRVDDKGLDRIHAMISLERDGRVLLTRGGEVSWVELNGHPVTGITAELRAGDEVRLGDAVFRLAAAPHVGASDEQAAYLRDVRRDRWYRLGDITAIGRDMSCAILLLEPEVSRTHAELVREANGYVVHPRRGVTLVNTRRALDPTPLEEGDEVTIGQTTLRFTTSPPPRGASAPARLSSSLREVAQMQTTFMSPLAAREQVRQRRRRRTGAIVAGVCAVAVLVAIGIGAATGARPVRVVPADSMPAATLPAPESTQVEEPNPRLPDSVPPLESEPVADEPITAGATKRPRP